MDQTTDARKIAGELVADPDFKKSLAAAITETVKAVVEAEPGTDHAEQVFAPAVMRNPARTDERDTRSGSQKAGAFAKFLMLGDGTQKGAVSAAEKQGDTFMAKSLSMADFTAGGALVPVEYANDIFEALRPKSVIRSMGADVFPMVNGSLVLPGITGGATASYKGETQGGNASAVTTGDIRLVEKELICIVPMSSSLARSNSRAAEQAISRDMVRAMAQKENEQFINGNGANGTPLGILSQIAAANVTATAGGYTTLANADTDKKNLQATVRANNVDVSEAGGYLMTTTIEETLMSIRSGDMKAFPEMENGLYGKYPYMGSNVVPSGYLIFGDWSDVVIADSEQIEMAVSDVAAYQDSAGTLRAPFSRNEVVLRVTAKHDIALRRSVALAAKTGVA